MKQCEQMAPPKLAIKLLRVICHPDYREEIEGDVLEKYNTDLLNFGYKVARKNIWWQVLLLARPNLIFNLTDQKMKKFFNPYENPQGMLVLAAFFLIVVIASAFLFGFDFADKTMFTFQLSEIVWFIPLILIFCWMVYITTNKLLYSTVFSRMHIVATVVVTVALAATAFFASKPYQAAIHNFELVGNIIHMLVLLFVLVQFILISNLLIGLVIRFGKYMGLIG